MIKRDERNDLKEWQARERWCPFARVEDSEGAHNRYPGKAPEDLSPCIASRCAAWRWADEDMEVGRCGRAG